MLGKSGGSCEAVLHKNHKDIQEGQHEIAVGGCCQRNIQHRFPISRCPVSSGPKGVFIMSTGKASWSLQ